MTYRCCNQAKPWCAPLLTVATVLPGLSVAHYFIRPWLVGNVLQDFSKLVPVIIV
jgi:hypothetical protein